MLRYLIRSREDVTMHGISSTVVNSGRVKFQHYWFQHQKKWKSNCCFEISRL